MDKQDHKRGDTVGLLFPKKKTPKRRRKHTKSILHKKDGTCYLCMRRGDYRMHRYLEEHHIFGGPNRAHSEAEGLKVYLCPECHRGKHGVHADITAMRQLQRVGQWAYEQKHSREQFMQLFGRNYMEDQDGTEDKTICGRQ